MSKALVIVPTYNEADNIINLIERVLSLSVTFNILVVDDNSPDNTGSLVSTFALSSSERVFLLSSQFVWVVFCFHKIELKKHP